MAPAGCLHMAQCRRASLQFLICQQRIRGLLTEILPWCLSANKVSHPCSSPRVAWFKHTRSILLLTCILQKMALIRSFISTVRGQEFSLKDVQQYVKWNHSAKMLLGDFVDLRINVQQDLNSSTLHEFLEGFVCCSPCHWLRFLITTKEKETV